MILRVVLGDQLSGDLAALSDLDPKRDVVLMMEVRDEVTYVPHHKQKIVLFLSAMRHFAEEMRSHGIAIDYVKLDDPTNTGSFIGEVKRAVARHRPARIVVTEAGEWRVQTAIEGWSAAVGVPVEIREDTRFFSSRARFREWSKGRKSWRMEHFYREMRREHGLLMDKGQIGRAHV